MNKKKYKKIKQVSNALINKLEDLHIEPICNETASVKLTHIHWMLITLQDKSWHYGKANRWLAWCQCVLHYNEIINAEDERNFTRNIFNGQ